MPTVSNAISQLFRWVDRNILELGREFRLSYLPPLMVYLAYGVSALTSIVGTFFVKDYLGLSAAFLAALGFWAGIPWALKMPLGHLVDLAWRYKYGLVYVGAGLITTGLLVMVGLIGHRDAMAAIMPVENWYVLSALLSPVGYVLQDAVADAMTVEAVPRIDRAGLPIPPEQRKLMHTTMQTLGRVAIIGGSVFVALVNLWLFTDSEHLPRDQEARIYRQIYSIALSIPAISVAGVAIAAWMRARERRRLLGLGHDPDQVAELLGERERPPRPNWWILGGSLAFVVFTVSVGLGEVPYNQEIVFAGSMAIVLFLIVRLTRELDAGARAVLVSTAAVIFAFRAVPGPGPGVTWWTIDQLKFDQHFLSKLSLIGSALALAGMFIFRRFMAVRSIGYIVGWLTLASTLLSLPILGMVHGLHDWTAAHTSGVVDARFIALVDTALESPLGQVAMIPMLAWIASSAPAHLKATYFAVMASFTNLALSLNQLGTKYLNQIFVVSRAIKHPVTGIAETPANYGALGPLLATQILIGLALPLAAILVVKMLRSRTA